MLKKGTPASPATALANKVFPVPGGPTSKIPLGILAPRRVNLCGFFKNSTTSCSSSLASSTPATSLKVTLLSPSLINLARLLTKEKVRFPGCTWRIKRTQSMINTKNGSQEIRKFVTQPP